MKSKNYLECNRGFGLAATIMLLVVFAVLGLTGLSLARQEQHSQIRRSARSAAFYAAETGLTEGLRNWTKPTGEIPAGTSWFLTKGAVPGGSRYKVQATKLDDNAIHALYSVRSEGYAYDGTTQHVGMLVKTLVIENPMKAALEVLDSAIVKGTTTISGIDTIPFFWQGPYCTARSPDATGLLMSDTSKIEYNGTPQIYGDPPIGEVSDTAGFFNFGNVTFDDLVAMADIRLPDGTVIDSLGVYPRPSYNADGSCNTADPYNWGDPENPGRPCSDWFPIIYAEGDLGLVGNQAGQGLLLVEGNLKARGGFEFYGPVIVRGTFTQMGTFLAYGGVKAARGDFGAGTADVVYSECVVQRALSHISAAKPVPLQEHAWYQVR
jgi:hypothetical protein